MKSFKAFAHQDNESFFLEWILFVGENDLIDPDEFNQAVSDLSLIHI